MADTRLTKLDSIVEQYYEDKSHLDNYKKICDASNLEIKDIMTQLNLDKHTVGNITATKSVSVKETFNEAKLINLLENSTYHVDGVSGPICIASGLNIVKQKPYVDMDALEDAIYKGLIPEDVLLKMNDCKESKETVSLRVTRTLHVTRKKNKEE